MGVIKLLELTELPEIKSLDEVKFARRIDDKANAIVHSMVDPAKRDSSSVQILGLLLGKVPNMLKAQYFRQCDLNNGTLRDLLEFLDAEIKSYDLAAEIASLTTKAKHEVKE